MKVIDKDITTVTEGIIVHQVNTAGVMGAGVAKALANEYPKLLDRYENFTNGFSEDDLLGIVCWYDHQHKGNLYIANLYGQHLYDSDYRDCRKTSYDATVEGWLEIKRHSADLPVYMPYLMGCGLGGGNWNIYSAIVYEIMGEQVIACRI